MTTPEAAIYFYLPNHILSFDFTMLTFYLVIRWRAILLVLPYLLGLGGIA